MVYEEIFAIEDLEQRKSLDVDEIRFIKIDRRKSSNGRLLDFLTRIKNLYVFKVN